MVIIYGFGKHARNSITQYCVKKVEIEAIIDQKLSDSGMKKEIGIDVITWEDYCKNHQMFKSTEIVIGSKVFYDEIANKIASSGYSVKVSYIDEWIKQYTNVEELITAAELEERFKYISENVTPPSVELIAQENLKHAKVLSNRDYALYEIPKNGICAEVGVAFGDFSRKILDIVKPSKFYAIDIFNEQTPGFWNNNVFLREQLNHYDWYKNKFKKEFEEKLLIMRKGLSWDCLNEFEDDYFDYLYLDAGHDYDSVKKDVDVLIKKVKNGGIIQFNDYIVYDYVAKEHYGVVSIVNELINRTNSEVLFYCLSNNGFDDIVIRLNK